MIAMKRFGLILLAVVLPSCASLRAENTTESARLQLWRDAHEALGAVQFGRADTLFTRIVTDHGATETGRESLFYLGTIRLDPRNPSWSSERAEAALAQYLRADTSSAAVIHRRPEAVTLFALAQQLNMPAEERVPGLQSEPRVVVQRVVVPARQAGALATEVARLREQVAARDAQIRRQEEELDRIRKTLSAPR